MPIIFPLGESVGANSIALLITCKVITIVANIKSWADALANLLIEQGGFPEREMRPKRQLNERQPFSEKTDGGYFYIHHHIFGLTRLKGSAFDIQLVRRGIPPKALKRKRLCQNLRKQPKPTPRHRQATPQGCHAIERPRKSIDNSQKTIPAN